MEITKLQQFKNLLNKEETKNPNDIDWDYVVLLEKYIKRLTK